LSLEFLKSDQLFDAKIKETYAIVIKEKETKDKKPKTSKPVDYMAQYTKTLLGCYLRADQKTIIKARQVFDTAWPYVKMMSDPRLADRIMVDVVRARYMEKLKNE